MTSNLILVMWDSEDLIYIKVPLTKCSRKYDGWNISYFLSHKDLSKDR